MFYVLLKNYQVTKTLPGMAKADRKTSPPPGPKIYVFVYFLQLGVSKWAEIVPYEQGVSLRHSGHPTCLYSEEKRFWPTMAPLAVMGNGKWAMGNGPLAATKALIPGQSVW